MANTVVPIERQVFDIGVPLIPASIQEAIDLATVMAKAKLVPAALQGSPADCLMVVMQAKRWKMDPFAVAQECSVISGKLMHSGKLTAAVINTLAPLQRRFEYRYGGEGEARFVEVIGLMTGEAQPRVVKVELKNARTSNQMWTKQPDQQLAYHGARVWARRFVPELMLGVFSPEEFDRGRPIVEVEATVTPESENGVYDVETGEVIPAQTPGDRSATPGADVARATPDPAKTTNSGVPSGTPTAVASATPGNGAAAYLDAAKKVAASGKAALNTYWQNLPEAAYLALKSHGAALHKIAEDADARIKAESDFPGDKP